MPTLYVENVPEELYEAIRTRAQGNRKSISAEVITLLAENVPTPSELARRKKLFDQFHKLHSERTEHDGQFATSEELQRKDRTR